MDVARFCCGLFVPKPNTETDCQGLQLPDLGTTVRQCPGRALDSGPVFGVTADGDMVDQNDDKLVGCFAALP